MYWQIFAIWENKESEDKERFQMMPHSKAIYAVEDGEGQELSGKLICHNINLSNRRTSVKLEPEIWEALQEIAELKGCTINDLCRLVEEHKSSKASFASALRVYVVKFLREQFLTHN